MNQEGRLQRKIIKDLDLSGWEAHKVMKSTKSGWPDVEAFKAKRTIFIETKSKGKKAKPLQVYRHDRLRAQGFDVFVIDTWELYEEIKKIHHL